MSQIVSVLACVAIVATAALAQNPSWNAGANVLKRGEVPQVCGTADTIASDICNYNFWGTYYFRCDPAANTVKYYYCGSETKNCTKTTCVSIVKWSVGDTMSAGRADGFNNYKFNSSFYTLTQFVGVNKYSNCSKGWDSLISTQQTPSGSSVCLPNPFETSSTILSYSTGSVSAMKYPNRDCSGDAQNSVTIDSGKCTSDQVWKFVGNDNTVSMAMGIKFTRVGSVAGVASACVFALIAVVAMLL